MAGPQGFEPWYAEIKTPCLTAWRRPINQDIYFPNFNFENKGDSFTPLAR
jgi:hypothetical protein